MPQFAMSVFLLPMSMCSNMERLMNAFWWHGRGISDRGINWLSWERMAVPKKFGGLGFKHLHGFNIAMLGKQGWRLLTQPDALVSRVFKARYFPTTSFLEAKLGGTPSYCWRSILVAQPLIRVGARRRIGNGSDTLV
ncbi:unnamed protein product [Cuscuta campestris]|uniref:Reverse transcriptase zinc-binding domain-containing protein n=1 Tax=Cuscuta campestris TaxID=132261 RepID=A0A484LKJ9_9ASTE|nr:unnamed protein product [Cuscuta campestris]